MDQFSHFTVRFCSCLSREIFFMDLFKFSLNFFANAVICMLFACLIALSSLLFTGDDIFSVLGNIYRRLMNVFTFGNLSSLLSTLRGASFPTALTCPPGFHFDSFPLFLSFNLFQPKAPSQRIRRCFFG